MTAATEDAAPHEEAQEDEDANAFDQWLEAEAFESHQHNEVPLVTQMLYEVCDHDAKKFARVMEALIEAFTAGRLTGQDDVREIEIARTHMTIN
jgi:hypothetical protein